MTKDTKSNCKRSRMGGIMIALACLLTASGLRAAQSSQADHSEMDHSAMSGMASGHKDHNPKHGGIFFMAMDNIHHLEGVLESPGVFRVYVYNSHTKPLTKAQMKLLSGKVLVGDDVNAPEVPLQLSADGQTMQMSLPAGCPMPVTLTLLMRFPGMKKDAKPELFTFPFSGFTPAAHDAGPATEMHDHHMGM